METLEWRNSEDVAKWFQIKNIDENTHKNWLKSLENENPANIAFVIATDDSYVGVTYFHSIDYKQKQCDIGIYLTKLRGQGIGKDVFKQMLEYAKNVLKADTVYLHVKSDNLRAIRLYKHFDFEPVEKCGDFIKYKKSLI